MVSKDVLHLQEGDGVQVLYHCANDTHLVKRTTPLRTLYIWKHPSRVGKLEEKAIFPVEMKISIWVIPLLLS